MESIRKPFWIRSRVSASKPYQQVSQILKKQNLHTVCEEAMCPNKCSCWEKKDVTFLIMGTRCTRNCRFCNVEEGPAPEILDESEPEKIAKALKALATDYAVITSVTRDDLADSGCSHFVQTTRMIKKSCGVPVELLIPDFQAKEPLLKAVMDAGPSVIGHNIETVERLYPSIRPASSYKKTLDVLRCLRRSAGGIPVKSALMVGLGESKQEIIETAQKAREAGVDIFYIGQYLQPSRKHVPVDRYYAPEEFQELSSALKDMDFSVVLAGPFIRSSYQAKESFLKYLHGRRELCLPLP
ncbi:MAG: lipoyl synthase [Candidatus Aureabacteria bacterium]|nr:lipoyl synthase [Candidatus Auribacterota bacterium]